MIFITIYNIHNLKAVFIHRFPILAPEIEVGKKLKLIMFSIIYNQPYESFDKDYLLYLRVRFRIFSTIKPNQPKATIYIQK